MWRRFYNTRYPDEDHDIYGNPQPWTIAAQEARKKLNETYAYLERGTTTFNGAMELAANTGGWLAAVDDFGAIDEIFIYKGPIILCMISEKIILRFDDYLYGHRFFTSLSSAKKYAATLRLDEIRSKCSHTFKGGDTALIMVGEGYSKKVFCTLCKVYKHPECAPEKYISQHVCDHIFEYDRHGGSLTYKIYKCEKCGTEREV